MVQMEGQSDDIHAGPEALQAAWQTDPLTFLIQREIYSHLEKVVDRFEDVANEIDGLVIDHA
jgi:uncharacterized protein Yka (UPF0111/DUF47 family)